MTASLHNHDEFSVLDGFSKPREYLERAREIGLKAFAITNHGNMYSYVYYDEIKKEFPEIKMIYGVEFYECFDINEKDANSKYFHLVALAKNERGRIALNELTTKANFEGFYYKPRVDLKMLKEYAEDLIISSACLASKLSREKDYNKCIEYVNEYKSIFPHFYLEIQSHDDPYQFIYNTKVLQLAKDTNTEFIITTDSHVAKEEDLYYQARHVQIAHDSETMSESYSGCYLQTDEEIHNILDKNIGYENVEIGLRNTDKIADMIEVVNMPFQEPKLPTFPLPKGFSSNNEYLKYLLAEGWKNRGCNKLSEIEQKIREKRVKHELKVISKMHYEGYFLIVWDFINWARENKIMVGAGRGSGAGSLICYLMGITDIDPIKYNLIFERFLNEERISLPDLDIDLGDRGRVIKYLTDKYGQERVCQIINFSYITPTVAIKDVARVLKIPYALSEKISKRFAYETFEECVENNPNILDEFKNNEHYEKIQDLLKIAAKLSGRVRQASCHAGGVGIVDTKITDYMAMKLGSKDEHIIQVDKRYVEKIGIVKFDLLGVQTLNVVQQVLKEAGISEWEININNPKFEKDFESYELLSSANTNGVFQVESSGMKELLVRLKPHSLEELSALIALYRPDSMQFIEPYIHNKFNPEDTTYIHDDMIEILGNTYGCMLYQEQLLDIVRKFGGRTYGGADKFRKGIGKKDKNLIKEESDKLYNEIRSKGYDQKIAKEISDDMSTKGGYLFNKSHSISYAVLCLQTAYLKKHYPVYFYKALLDSKKDKTGVLNKYIVDALDFGVKVLPPHINKSQAGFSVEENAVLFGLEAIRGIGENVTNLILEERNSNGKFKGFDNFLERIKPSEAQVVSLAKAGCFPTKDKKGFLERYAEKSFKGSQYKEVKSLPTKKKLKEEWGIDKDLYKDKEEVLKLYNDKRRKLHGQTVDEKKEKHLNLFKEKHLKNEHMWEFESLSIFLTDNPFKEAYKYITDFEEVENNSKGVMVGVISDITKKKDRNKKQFAYMNLYSATGIYELVCWSSSYAKYQDIIKKDNIIAVLYSKKEDKAYVDKIKPYDQWLKDRIKVA